jgi:hypothetical protein
MHVTIAHILPGNSLKVGVLPKKMGIRFSAFANLFKGIRGPIALILQGMVIVLVGLIMILGSLNNTASYLKASGHLETAYINQYDANQGAYLKLAGSQELYSATLADLHPAWDGQFFKNQRVDIYYEDRQPKVVVAMQLYDQFGEPALKLTTTTYDQNPTTYQIGAITPQVGIVVLVAGLVVTGIFAFVYIMRRRNTSFA